jgi:hypothetical protein
VVLIGGIVGVVIVVGVAAAIVLLRRSQDDVHSVEHYHRQLHTLEEIRTHPTGTAAGAGSATEATTASATGTGAGASTGHNGSGRETFPASAFRISGSSTVRLTESGRPPVPPVPPPPVPNPAEPVSFDDANPEPVPKTFMSGNEDRVIQSIHHRPRRLGGPVAAVAAVAVLIVVLILTGLHSDTPSKHHGKSANAATTATSTPKHHATAHHHATTSTTTTTTAPPPVSAPASVSAHTATYNVAAPDYSLTLAATAGQCWVEATNTATGAVLFTTTLLAGQSHTIAATGPVTVIAGAPGAFAATVNLAPVTLPLGNQAPFTLQFETASGTPTA